MTIQLLGYKMAFRGIIRVLAALNNVQANRWQTRLVMNYFLLYLQTIQYGIIIDSLVKKKIERSNWFTNGLEILKNEDFLKITVDNLCNVYNLTKRPVIHHFKNVVAYIDSLMKYWGNNNTRSLMIQVDKIKKHLWKNKKSLISSYPSVLIKLDRLYGDGVFRLGR